MIESIRIENLGVIEEAELRPGPGLGALTGETGAGKTMALTSLQLLLGARPDPAKVRHGAEAARVEGTFVVPADSPVLDRIDDAGGTYEIDGEEAVVIVARHVPAQGRSRAFAGGRSVPAATLADITASLVTVHGQMDQIRLVGPSRQRQAVDAFGGLEISEALDSYRRAHVQWNEAQRRLEDFDAHAKQAARERLALEALVAKIDEVAPQPGEEAELKAEALRLENAAELYAAYDGASALLQGSDDVEASALGALGAAIAALEATGSEAEDLRARLRTVEAEIADIGRSLGALARSCDGDPDRLGAIYTRRQRLAGLRKELGMDLDDAVAEAAGARETLDALGDPEAARARREEEAHAARAAMLEAAAALTRLRTKAAGELEALVEKGLADLALGEATFRIDISESEPAAHGMDKVTFNLASHRQAPLRALAEAASGGELSRVMLALEVALATRTASAGHTFLFDEVDAGVGGKAALAVGAKLKQVAKTSQVLVVTHLAQVAAYADSHIRVVKETAGEATRTTVAEVTGKDREDELARMLSGTDSNAAHAHAAELLASLHMA